MIVKSSSQRRAGKISEDTVTGCGAMAAAALLIGGCVAYKIHSNNRSVPALTPPPMVVPRREPHDGDPGWYMAQQDRASLLRAEQGGEWAAAKREWEWNGTVPNETAWNCPEGRAWVMAKREAEMDAMHVAEGSGRIGVYAVLTFLGADVALSLAKKLLKENSMRNTVLTIIAAVGIGAGVGIWLHSKTPETYGLIDQGSLSMLRKEFPKGIPGYLDWNDPEKGEMMRRAAHLAEDEQISSLGRSIVESRDRISLQQGIGIASGVALLLGYLGLKEHLKD